MNRNVEVNRLNGFKDVARNFQSLVGHLEEQDVEAFTNAVKEYDSVNRLDTWYTTMLLRVKKQIPVEDDLC